MTIQVSNIEIESKLKGRLYQPSKPGKYPAVVICHGYPGDTKNMDLAEELALNDIIVLIFYYQGAWRSTGTYRFSNLVPNTLTALKYLKALDSVDTTRIALIGHSMGALPLTRVLCKDTTIKTGVYMAPASDISTWLYPQATDTIFERFIGMAEGKLAYGDKEEYKEDMMKAATDLNPIEIISKVKAPILVVVGSNDKITHPEQCRSLYEEATPPKEWNLIEGADHSFTEHRLVLQEIVLQWLKQYL